MALILNDRIVNRIITAFVFLASFLFTNVSLAEITVQDLSVKDFFKADTFSQPKLSPNGKYIAVISPIQNVPNLVLFNTDGLTSPKPLTGITKDSVRHFFWANDSTIIFQVDSKDLSYYDIYAVNIDGKIRIKRLVGAYFSRGGLRYARIVNSLKGDSNSILVSYNERDGKVRDIFKLPVDSYWNSKKRRNYKMKAVARNSGRIIRWFFDNDGNVRAAHEKDGSKLKLLYKTRYSTKFSTVKTWDLFGGRMIPIGFDDKKGTIIVKSNLGRDRFAIYSFSPNTGKFKDLIYENHEFEIINSDSFKVDESAKLKFVRLNSPIPTYVYFQPELIKLHSALDPLFPDKKIHVVSENKKERIFIIKVLSDVDIGTYYLYDEVNGKVKYLMHKNIALKPELMSPMKPFHFNSRDGVTINGLITIPKSTNGNKIPIIINPHGGPFGIFDWWKFNKESQFFASRGYATVQVNFRGSGGYGKKFEQLGYGAKWGAEMQNDLTDTVKHFIDNGIADSKRVCIYGASYGGYAVMSGLTTTPELYSCGVNYVGVSDIRLLFEKSDLKGNVEAIHWLKTVIASPENHQLMDKMSPLNHLDKIIAPLMVVHGFHDRRVHRDHAIALKDKLKELGKPLSDDEWIMNLKEGHGFYLLESKIELYTKMEKFFAKNL